MNQETKDELKSTVLKVRDVLQAKLHAESTHEERDWVLFEIEHDEAQKAELCGRLTDLFGEHHPEYVRHIIGFGGSRARLDPTAVVRRMATQPFRNLKRLPTPDELLAVVDEFEAFTDSNAVEVEYVAPLVNMIKGPEKEVPVFHDAAIRLIGEDDKARIDSLVLWSPLSGQPLPDWALTMRVSHKKRIIQDEKLEAHKEYEKGLKENWHISDWFDKAILILRTFKPGPVYYHAIFHIQTRFNPMGALPAATAPSRFSHATGSYVLEASEIEALLSHAALFELGELDRQIQLACSRLAEAEVRLNSRDQLLDAVVGLDALLLGAPYPGEQREVFSLRYAALQPRELRLESYKEARAIYGARNSAAHGNKVKGNLKKLAPRGCEMLRSTIKRFLPSAAALEYKKPDFWEKVVLDVE